jgi:hypothetical protein
VAGKKKSMQRCRTVAGRATPRHHRPFHLCGITGVLWAWFIDG